MEWLGLALLALVGAGIILILNGLQAEMIARTYHESQDKPIYVIREVREMLPDRSREVIRA